MTTQPNTIGSPGLRREKRFFRDSRRTCPKGVPETACASLLADAPTRAGKPPMAPSPKFPDEPEKWGRCFLCEASHGPSRRKAPGPLFVWLATLLAAVTVFGACSRPSGEPAEDAAPREARSQVERGPVRVSVEVKPARVRLSDDPMMTLTVEYLPGVTVEKPVFADSIGDFRIRDTSESLPQVKDDREVIEQVFTLEPTQTGQLPIYPIPVTFADTRPDGDGKQHTVETEEITVEVVSEIDSEVTSLEELRAAAPPVSLPRPLRVLLWIVAAAVLIVGGLLLWCWRRRRRKVAAEKQLSPQERAYMALEELWKSGLAQRDAKLYYVEVTGIVRRFIEWTTGIRAPEQTTEEFLREISQKETFEPDESRRLKDFLEAADLVKFAAHRPRREDIDESFRRAKIFIGHQPTEAAA